MSSRRSLFLQCAFVLVAGSASPRAAAAAGSAAPPAADQDALGDPAFVRVEGNHFVAGGRRYAFVGANLWYGAHLGADDATGDRPRLLRELDRLAQLGVRNLRIMAGTEGPDSEPWRVVPALQPQQGVYRQAVLNGLDFVLAEMGKRHMRAVLCLSNYWQWSGGFAQYVRWNGGGPIPYPPPEPNGDWDRYRRYAELFYTNSRARDAFAAHARFMASRTNGITGVAYKDDPTIMTWELANEPGEPADGAAVPAFLDWIATSARLLKGIDGNHLVISGSEGPTTEQVQRLYGIDYGTTHVWPQNAGWYDPQRPSDTYGPSVSRAQQALESQRQVMARVGRPLVLAEFGLARDNGDYRNGTPTTYRADFFTKMMQQVLDSARRDDGIAGVAFWAWAGEGRPWEAGGLWRPGAPLLGDPPHERQGWYSVYDDDRDVLDVVRTFAGAMNGL